MSSILPSIIDNKINEKLIKERIRSIRNWERNKANPYPCPECGRTINKSNASRHNRSMAHRLAVLESNMTH